MKDYNINKALLRVCDLIDKRKIELGEATIHTYDDGASLNFFNAWNDSIVEGAKMLPIKKFGNYPDDKKLQMVYSKEGTLVPLHDFEAKKTYVVLRGEIDFFFDDDSKIKVTDLSSIIVPKGILHGGTTIKDSFVLVIEDQCECDSPLS